jgi:hypothetical protein
MEGLDYKIKGGIKQGIFEEDLPPNLRLICEYTKKNELETLSGI